MSDRAPNLAWALATAAMCCALNLKPLNAGVSIATVGRWRMAVNNSKLELVASVDGMSVTLPPFEVYVAMPGYAVFGLLGPGGGIIGGGPTEDDFIDDMANYLPPDELAAWGDDLEQRKAIRQ